jgi:hypothetical protein
VAGRGENAKQLGWPAKALCSKAGGVFGKAARGWDFCGGGAVPALARFRLELQNGFA